MYTNGRWGSSGVTPESWLIDRLREHILTQGNELPRQLAHFWGLIWAQTTMTHSTCLPSMLLCNCACRHDIWSYMSLRIHSFGCLLRSHDCAPSHLQCLRVGIYPSAPDNTSQKGAFRHFPTYMPRLESQEGAGKQLINPVVLALHCCLGFFAACSCRKSNV